MAQNLDPTVDVARVTRRFALVGIVAPALLTVAAIAFQIAWLPDTPDPIATHWGWVNGPDGSGPGWTYPLLTVLLGFGLSAWLWATALPRLRKGARGWTFRFLAAMALGLSAFGAVSMTWSVGMQRGPESWKDAPSVWPALLAGAAAGVTLGFTGYFVQPKQVTVFEALPAAHVDVASGERVVWLGAARARGAGLVLVVLVGALLLPLIISSWLEGQDAIAWLVLGLGLLAGVGALMTLEADVRVDATGVEVKGPTGWPRSRVALSDVASASAITVEALGSFGGWGWRRRPGVTGVIMRSGEALRVERKDGHSLVVTVDDAATAAALVTALAARAEA